MGGRDWKIGGCGLLIGALVAFPAGMMVAGSGDQREDAKSGGQRSALRPPAGRDMYAPSFINDPYVREQQLRVVEALELSCRQLGEHCAEAKAARSRISERD